MITWPRLNAYMSRDSGFGMAKRLNGERYKKIALIPVGKKLHRIEVVLMKLTAKV